MTRKFETVCRERRVTEEKWLSDVCLTDPAGEEQRRDAGIGNQEVTNNCRSESDQQSSAMRVNPSRACLIGQAHISRGKLNINTMHRDAQTL